MTAIIMKEDIMKDLDISAASFQAQFERFLIGCEAVEQEAGAAWDRESLGEMQDHYAAMLVTIILRTITADGWVSDRETAYLNEFFGFTYKSGELEQVYESCKELITSEVYEATLADSITSLHRLNGKLADAYRALIALVCDIIARSDGFVTAEEKAEIAHIRALAEQN